MRVELLTVGDELLLGDTVNGNAAWLGDYLAGIGATVTRAVTVGDGHEQISAAVTSGLKNADVLIVTGGLGPTSDDLTRDSLAALAGVRLLRDAAVEAGIRDRSAAVGAALRPMALRMADVPEGAVVVPNPLGSAPGLRMEIGGGVVYALPGVPPEMRAIMTEQVGPRLRDLISGPVPHRRTLRTACVRESDLAAALEPVEAMTGISVAYLPEPALVKLRITATGPDADTRLGLAEEKARDLLGAVIYGSEHETLDQVVCRLLAERRETVAVAESLTAGLLGAELTARPGATTMFLGGVITYATSAKNALLGVPEGLLAEHGAVHPEVARTMAVGVRDRLGASWGLAVTGVAGPEPQDGKPVGTVHIGVAGPGSESSVSSPRLPVPGTGPEARPIIRRMTVIHALDLLRRRLLRL